MIRCIFVALVLNVWAVAGHTQSSCAKFGIFTLAENGTIASIKNCLNAGASVSARYGDAQWTLLQWFLAHSDDADAIQFLIEAGSDLEAADPKGITPLHLAAHARQVEAMRVMLDRGVDPNARDRIGRTPLALSLLTSHSPYTPYGRSQLQSLRAFEASGHDIYQMLVSAGADPLAISDRNETLLHFAVGTDLAEPEVVDLLIKAGIDVDAQDNIGRTALHNTVNLVAVPEVRALLMAAGANPNIEDEKGNRPIENVFRWNPWSEVLPDLLAVGMTFREDPARTFAQIQNEGCNTDDLNAFIQFGFDLSLKGPNGETHFHHLANCSGPEKYMVLLASEGLSPLALDNDGNTPLMGVVTGELYGSFSDADEAFAYLAAAGADPMQPNKAGISPWQAARENGLYEELLETFEIDLDVQDEAGQTYLHHAIL